MSWCDEDMVTCPKCGQSFSTPIECFQHRGTPIGQKSLCVWTKKTYPNGSWEKTYDRDPDYGTISAISPFGGQWRFSFKPKLFGAGPTGVRRRGKNWELHMTDQGWIWT